jgi:hypothetical protein
VNLQCFSLNLQCFGLNLQCLSLNIECFYHALLQLWCIQLYFQCLLELLSTIWMFFMNTSMFFYIVLPISLFFDENSTFLEFFKLNVFINTTCIKNPKNILLVFSQTRNIYQISRRIHKLFQNFDFNANVHKILFYI